MTAPGGGSAAPGWYPDPAARFAQRYFDGAQWTDQVTNGRGWYGPESAAPPQSRPVPGAGGGRPNPFAVVTVVVGALAMLLGLFAVPWISEDGVEVSANDIREIVDSSIGWEGDPPGFVGPYFEFGLYLAIFGLLVVALAAALTPSPTRTPLAIIAGVGGVAAVICHFVACNDLSDGELDLFSAGPWVVAAGMVLSVVGALIPPSRAPRPDPFG
ncbi:DUF2510 domain-containing protein [Frankia sp. CNm7]|uniref:DUF2510 domain-containing protein n=1 Tax=Frankia nepalensis TaxID=1836974 RepID=A0A937RAC1_9ACTN|nr:DUF2510 domain-containing protein [Frankia nepalensis]MBL7498654.1 DUF2510 domain-containing protein [Frankia nepalensis]MBL7509180.1 DUF2510 domain-containing protein [Frankia nepalensis]MBL7522718.1 DUF2510 domain-containing protein [Frankia nepalensis]MBL7628371.1 DUF2510 domain-containing protein [Frankia nepalensis]